jgi:hypothetical protein
VSGLASKPLRRFLAGLTSKPVATVSSGLISKPAAPVSDSLTSKPAVAVFSGLTSKLVTMVFSSLALKLMTIVSPGLASKSTVSFLVEPQNQDGGGFFGLGIKTDSSSFVIWALKSPRRFFVLGLKIKHASVCRLHHKTDGGMSTRDTRQDLATCLAWKQVWLGFSTLS